MNQIKGTLIRIQRDTKQTLGKLILFEGLNKIFECCTLELPYLENENDISCVYTGIHLLTYYKRPNGKDSYLFRNVINRRWIEIHQLNYYDQTDGCIGVGKDHIDIDNDGLKDITHSGSTINELMKATNKRDIILTIVNQY